MAAPVLGSADDVRRITGFSSAQIDEATINSFLSEADRKIRAQHYNKYMLDLFYATTTISNGQTNKVYETYFPIKSSTTPEVWVNGTKATVTTDYTFTGSTITFTASFYLCQNDRVNIFYTPEFYDDYANYIAAARMFATSVLDTSNGVMLQNFQHIKDQVTAFEKLIASKPHVARAVDRLRDNNLW